MDNVDFFLGFFTVVQSNNRATYLQVYFIANLIFYYCVLLMNIFIMYVF